jgi:adenylate cyclase
MAAYLEAKREGAPPLRLELAAGRRVVIGRSKEADWPVDHEPFLGRKHAEVWLSEGFLRVRRCPGSSNPVFFGGEPKEEFTLGAGEYFVIGKTEFHFGAKDAPKAAPALDDTPDVSHTLMGRDVYAADGEADHMRLKDLLELPEILRKKEGKDFHLHLAGLIRLATGARWACVMTEDSKVLGRDASDDTAEFAVSKSLVAKALEVSPQPTYYSWSQAAAGLQATVAAGVDWAVCAATKIPGGSALVFYAAGSGSRQQDHARFVGLVAEIVGRSFSVSRLETWGARLERFFPAAVVDQILGSEDMKDLQPKLAQSTVMFFDIRGFSKKTEGKTEKILAFQGELRRVMTAMTEEIQHENGVVLQYLGDGIMACWNVPMEDPRHVDRACRAALAMVTRLSETTDGWRCGIGLHTGEIVAGSMGSEQMFAYGIMGAVVNQSSRIEGITKTVEIPILVSEEVAKQLSPSAGSTLRIGRFQPAGMNTALDLYELSAPPGDAKRKELYTAGLAAFEAGDWEKSYEILNAIDDHRPARYLKSLAEYYRRHPPKDWKGIIELTEK